MVASLARAAVRARIGLTGGRNRRRRVGGEKVEAQRKIRRRRVMLRFAVLFGCCVASFFVRSRASCSDADSTVIEQESFVPVGGLSGHVFVTNSFGDVRFVNSPDDDSRVRLALTASSSLAVAYKVLIFPAVEARNIRTG